MLRGSKPELRASYALAPEPQSLRPSPVPGLLLLVGSVLAARVLRAAAASAAGTAASRPCPLCPHPVPLRCPAHFPWPCVAPGPPPRQTAEAQRGLKFPQPSLADPGTFKVTLSRGQDLSLVQKQTFLPD